MIISDVRAPEAAGGRTTAASATRTAAFLSTPPTRKQSRLLFTTLDRPTLYRARLRATSSAAVGVPSVPGAHVAVQRVSLYRGLAQRLDRADEVLGGRTMRGARRGDDVLLDHHGAHVVGAERESDLTDLHPLRHPARLNVVDVVEVDATDGLREEIVEGCRAHFLGNDIAQ